MQMLHDKHQTGQGEKRGEMGVGRGGGVKLGVAEQESCPLAGPATHTCNTFHLMPLFFGSGYSQNRVLRLQLQQFTGPLMQQGSIF